MLNNKWFWVVLLVVLALLVVFVPAAPRGLVGMPEEGSQLILWAVTAVVAWALLQISTGFGVDLSGYVQPIVAIIAPVLVTIAERYLGMIPPVFDNLVLSLIHLLALAIGSVGTLIAYRRLYTKDHKALLA